MVHKEWLETFGGKRDAEGDAGGGGGLPPGTPPSVAPPAKDPALERMENELKGMGERLGRAEGALQNQPLAINNAPPTAPAMGKEALEKEFFKNPLEMSAAIATKAAQDAVANLEAGNIDTQIEQARVMARSEDVAFFDKWRVEIEAKVMGMHPQFRKNVMIWRNAIKMTKGEHVDDIVREAQAKADSSTTTIHKGDGPAPPSPRAASPSAKEPLSEEEKTVAKGLKLSEDRYRRGKERYKNQEEAWSKVITLDSETKEAERAEQRRKAAGGK